MIGVDSCHGNRTCYYSNGECPSSVAASVNIHRSFIHTFLIINHIVETIGDKSCIGKTKGYACAWSNGKNSCLDWNMQKIDLYLICSIIEFWCYWFWIIPLLNSYTNWQRILFKEWFVHGLKWWVWMFYEWMYENITSSSFVGDSVIRWEHWWWVLQWQGGLRRFKWWDCRLHTTYIC